MTRPSCDLPARVVLLCGPPCGGKTTLARELAGEGDLVVDLDEVARELGSPVGWLHPAPYRDQAEQRVRALLDRLPGSAPGTAYVIRSLPKAQARAIASRMIKASETWVINPGRAECQRRSQLDGRPAGTEAEIAWWFDRYRSWSGDTARPVAQSNEPIRLVDK